MIDRYLLRYFLAVIDHGNFSRAAAHCRVSQPTLSVGIAKLEAEVGQTLFLRTNRRVELTGAGVRLSEHARKIEREFAMVEQGARSAAPSQTIRLGVLMTLPVRWIETAMAAARHGSESEQVEIVFGTDRTLLAQLDRGRLDTVLGIVRGNRARWSEPLFTEGYGLTMRIGHALAARAQVTAEEVAEGPMIVRRHCEVLAETSRYFTGRGVRPFMSARTGSDEQALAAVKAGLGFTVMPFCHAGDGVVIARLSDFDLTRTIGLIYERIPSERPASRALEIIAGTIERTQEQSRVP